MDILKKPLVTEKASELNEANKYAFIVDKRANKVEIKKAIKDMYGVSIVSINTMNYLGKQKTRYTKAGFISGRRASFKKAIVKVAEGDMIDFYNNI